MLGIMKSWKTTLIAILTALFGLLRTLGVIDIGPEVTEAIIIVAIFLLGLFSHDATQKTKT